MVEKLQEGIWKCGNLFSAFHWIKKTQSFYLETFFSFEEAVRAKERAARIYD